MKAQNLSAIVVLLLFAASATPAIAQQPRVSPHDIASGMIDGQRIMVVYGRPYSKNPRGEDIRKIWGGLVPYGQVWRMGANEATLLVTPTTLEMGGLEIPAGAYTLMMQPEEDGTAKLIISKQLGLWMGGRDESQDVGTVDMKREPIVPNVDQLTMSIDQAEGGGALALKWEGAKYSVPFKVKK